MSDLVIPSKIPWEEIKGKDLEEILYWLLDEMGAKDLEWRIGGSSGGAADQGRDLEAFFYIQGPDGEMIRQKWWIEAKGRSKTVETPVVREAIITASGVHNVDIILIATNTQFSNPTREWIKEWSITNPRIAVKLWDRNDLERFVCKHPSVISRLYPGALSLEGKLEVIRSQFWNHVYYSGTPSLSELWKCKAKLKWNNMSMIAVIAGEAANGDFASRPWPLILSNDELTEVLALSIVNTLPFIHRADRSGITTEHYLKAVSYIVLVALDRLGAKIASKVIENCWDVSGCANCPMEIRRLSINPVLRRLRDELFDVCTSDCTRISTDPFVLNKETTKNYWLRLKLPEKQGKNDKESKRILIIETFGSPCKAGFKLNKKRHCPLGTSEFDKLDDEKNEINIARVINIFEKVVRSHKLEKKRDNNMKPNINNAYNGS
ncbi:MAG: restriction endonuclease [Actinobacteria bacterium]|nr:restriction endonuclease [Actinomycetota bacterium]